MASDILVFQSRNLLWGEMFTGTLNALETASQIYGSDTRSMNVKNGTQYDSLKSMSDVSECDIIQIIQI